MNDHREMNEMRPKPANLQFGNEKDLMDDHIDDDFEDSGSSQEEASSQARKKKNSGARTILIAGVVFLVFILIGGGYFGYLIYKKKTAQAAEYAQNSAMPQPMIMEETPTAPVPLGANAQSMPQPQIQQQPLPSSAPVAGSPTVAPSANPVQTPVVPLNGMQMAAPAPEAPASQPVAQQANISNPVSPSAIKSVDQSMIESNAKDLQSIKTLLAGLQQRLDKLEGDVKSIKSTSAQAPAQQQVKVQPQVAVQRPAPAPAPVQSAQKPVVKTAQVEKKDETIEAPTLKDYYVSGIVNNRAFIVRKNLDGTELEQTVVVGDRLDNGRKILSIDPRDKSINLEGGVKISATRGK